MVKVKKLRNFIVAAVLLACMAGAIEQRMADPKNIVILRVNQGNIF